MQKKEAIKTLQRLGWVALLLLVGIVLINMVDRKQATKTTDVQVNIAHLPSGRDLITKGDVFEILDRSFGYSMEGIPHLNVDVERIERVLEDNPFVLDAEAYLGADNQVKIYLEQRIPVVRIIDRLDVSYYFDLDGNRLPTSRHFTARVLTATGNIPPHTPEFLERPNHPLNHLFQLSKLILADELFASMVEQIYVDKNQEYTLVPKLGDHVVKLGSFKDMDNKLRNLKVFYEKALPNAGWETYKTVDLRFKGQIVAEKK